MLYVDIGQVSVEHILVETTMSASTAKKQILLSVGSKKYQCSATEFQQLEARLAEGAKIYILPLKQATGEARTLWDSHNQAQKETFFLIPKVVDAWSSVSFPPENLVTKAEAAVSSLDAAIKRRDAAAIYNAYEQACDATDKAVTEMRRYHNGIIKAGGQVVSGLEQVRNRSVDLLKILGAFATGGSSVAVQASVAASVGGYEELIAQIDLASKPGKFDPIQSALTVTIKGSIEGLVAAVFHETGLADKLMDRAAKTLTEASLESVRRGLTREVVEKIWKKGMEATAKSALKDLIAKTSYDRKITLDDAAKHIAEQVVKEMGGSFFSGAAGKQLEALSKGSLKYVKPEWFKGLGKVDLEKAMKSGGEKIIEIAYEKYAEKFILAADDPKKLEKIPDDIVKAISTDQKVLQGLKSLSNKR